ncbi:XRE family transcriptional regulator (plasmid) [Amycolatopsis sp. AA4]|uniref:helix-turn-helix domain-containing protein n=1 Tax=Actinomycetes TaxID=1760 RepID=UPI0001B57161|nr:MULTISPECIES: helix-turn-helix transcriptional regulator [Actinomycetes]ATY17264.1 XRE family transcriptional regulator [Amycolatopsis sp. AA4]EFL12676.1 predicted protein [Streptomyces sp. AA4]
MIDAEHYQRVLGDELRKLRRGRGWTRKELNAQLQRDISLQTLATYELGTRQCSVMRLVELCVAMDELPHDLLAKVHTRVLTEQRAVRIDVAALLSAPHDSSLAPLTRWARATGRAEVELQPENVEKLARLCEISAAELLRRLRRYTTRPADDAGDGITAAPG